MMKPIINFLLTFFVSSILYAQQIDLPNIIPPSPDASSILAFESTEVDEYSGAVSRQIPIFNFTIGDVGVPISLNYKSGGFKVNESASWIGLGWSLSAGGVLARTVYGIPDDDKQGTHLRSGFFEFIIQNGVTFEHLTNSSNQDLGRFSQLHDIAVGCADSQPDIFSFNFAGYQGSFHFDWSGNLVVDSNRDVSVEVLWESGVFSKVIGAKFTVDDGTIFTFSEAESTKTIAGSFSSCLIPSQSYHSSWFLTEISTYNESRKILFEYDPYTIQDYNIFTSTMNRHLLSSSTACANRFQSFETSISSTKIEINGKRLKRIYSDNSDQEITFIPGSQRTDLTGIDLFPLNEILVFDGTDRIKKYELTHSYGTNRLTLDTLQEFDANDQAIPAYEFFYTGSLAARNSKNRDHWGYENSNPNNDLFETYIVTHQSGSTSNFGNGNREPDFNGSISGVMHKIVFPTGGYDQYTFENHEYGFVGGAEVNQYVVETVNKYVGAYGPTRLTCDSITTDEETETFTIDPDPNNPTASIYVQVSGNIFWFEDPYFGAGHAPKVEIFDSNGNLLYQSPNGPGNFYNTLSLPPGTYSMKASATWKDCYNNGAADAATMSIMYQNYTSELVTSKTAGGVRIQKLEKFDNDDTPLHSFTYDYTMDDGSSSGFIHKEPRYTYDTQVYSWVSTTSVGGYETSCPFTIALDSDVSGLGITSGGHIGYKKVTVTQSGGSNGFEELYFRSAHNFVNDNLPFPPAENNSHNAGLIDSTKTRTAGSTLVFKRETTYGLAEKLTSGFKVHAKGAAASAPFEQKFDKAAYNIILAHKKPIGQKQIEYRGGLPVQNDETIVYDSELHKVKEVSLSSSKSDKTYISKTFYPEDKNLLSNVSPSFDSAIGLLQQQNRSAIVLQTEEYDKEGNNPERLLIRQRNSYDIFSNSIVEPDSILSQKTGGDLEARIVLKDYDTEGNPLVVSKADGPTTVYVWGYEGQFPVAKVENATYTAVENILGTGFDLGSGGLNTAQADALRSGLANSLVTTYTYDPMVGVTSITDPSGYTMYYEYDGYNRLEAVRDGAGQLVTDYKYHYKNQQ